MTSIDVVTATWSGFPGGPGTSTFHMTHVTHTLTALHDFFGVLLGIIPDTVKIDVANAGPTISDANGELVAGWAAAPTSQMSGSNNTKYAAGVGAVVRWNTGIVTDGRMIKGHTFLVPVYGGAFDTNGSLNDSDKALIQGAADDLVTAYTGELLVWHRPKKDPVTHAITRNGSSENVSDALCIDRTAVLRSRRN